MEHKKKIWLKGILAVALFVMVFITYLSPVFAAINNSYNSDTGVTQNMVQKSINNDNPLVDPIANFVYFIGATVEWLLGSMTGMVTGMNTMPWADMIIYNSVAMLDINFLNPDTNSMVSQLDAIIKKTYYTIFSLALAFFGVAVAVMAIKLAISSIAEEKAKYKSAITSWLMAVVLLFTMHYFMSFIFYLNESVVELASNIASDSIESSGKLEIAGSTAYSNLLNYASKTGTDNYEFVKDKKNLFTDFLNDTSGNIQQYITQNRDLGEGVIDFWFGTGGTGDAVIAFGKLCENVNNDKDLKEKIYGDENFNIKDKKTREEYKSAIADYIKIAGLFYKLEGAPEDLKDGIMKEYNENYIKVQNDEKYIKIATGVGLKTWYEIYQDGTILLEDTEGKMIQNSLLESVIFAKWGPILGKIPRTSAQTINWTDFIPGVAQIANITDAFKEFGSVISSQTDITMVGQFLYYVDLANNKQGKDVKSAPVSQLANYFKYSAFEVSGDGIMAKTVNPVFCFLYTIFVFQSLLYFFAYIKRFFYIIVLALMAPIVIVYDFVSKIL